MRNHRSRACLLFAVSAALFVSACGGAGLSISLTQPQLQRIVNAVFPLEGERDAVGVSLTDPAVALQEGSDRIAFGLDLAVSVVLEPGEGRVAEAAEARAQERAATTEPATGEGGRGARVRSKVRGKAQDKAQEARQQAQDRVEERVENRDPEVLSGTVTVSTAVRYEASTGELFLTDFAIEQLEVDQLPGRLLEAVTNLASNVVARGLNQVPIYEIDDAGLGGSIARALLDEVVVRDGVLTISVGLGP